jgi:GRASP55/65 PDZ-like domain
MRICEPEFALENVWHVMDVLEGSPAESAGLVPYGDWIIGWSGGVLGAESDFYDVVEAVRVLLLDVRLIADALKSILTNLFVSTFIRMTLSGSCL